MFLFATLNLNLLVLKLKMLYMLGFFAPIQLVVKKCCRCFNLTMENGLLIGRNSYNICEYQLSWSQGYYPRVRNNAHFHCMAFNKTTLNYLFKAYSHELGSSPCIYPWLVKKIGGQVGASITMLSIQVAHVLCMERKTLLISTRDFLRRCILARFKTNLVCSL